jgi:hypothetical protein
LHSEVLKPRPGVVISTFLAAASPPKKTASNGKEAGMPSASRTSTNRPSLVRCALAIGLIAALTAPAEARQRQRAVVGAPPVEAVERTGEAAKRPAKIVLKGPREMAVEPRPGFAAAAAGQERLVRLSPRGASSETMMSALSRQSVATAQTVQATSKQSVITPAERNMRASPRNFLAIEASAATLGARRPEVMKNESRNEPNAVAATERRGAK